MNSSEFGYMRYLHSYSAAADAAKEVSVIWYSSLVLVCFFSFFHTSIQEYAFMVCGMSILVR